MSEDQFTKLFKLIQKFQEENSEEHRRIREDFSQLQSSVDAYAKKADTYF